MTNNQKWCPVCEGGVTAKTTIKPKKFSFKGEDFEVDVKVMICPVCNEELVDEETDNETMKQLAKLYMERKGLTFDDIKSIREQYGLSMELFAKILGWAKTTIVRYESGNFIPDSSHMGILKQLKGHPDDIEIFYKQNKHKFNEKQKAKIKRQIKNMESEVVETGLLHLLKLNYKYYEGTIESGYTEFTPEKLKNMVIYFSKSGVPITKLMKLLWYSDFISFRRNINSISGLPYIRLQHGPVPKDYTFVLTTLEKNDFIESNEIQNGDFPSTIIQSRVEFDEKVFSNEEFEVIRFVNNFFEGYGSVKISEFSHKEKGWRETTDKQIISYSFADHLNIG